MNYIRLYSNCYPVKGSNRSLIIDLQRERFDFIPNSMYQLLANDLEHSIPEIKSLYGDNNEHLLNEYFNFLLSNEYAFLCKSKEELAFFPEINFEWDSPYPVTNAIIDFDTKKFNIEKLIFNLESVSCRTIEIRLFMVNDFYEIRELIGKFNNSSFLTINLKIQYLDGINAQLINKLFSMYNKLYAVEIYNSPFDEENFEKSICFFSKSKMDNCSFCGGVNKRFYMNMPFLCESLKYNNCLNRKISVDVDGNIKNCPSMSHSFGNIESDEMKKIISLPAFKKYWGISKDKVEVCKDCEFRYSCIDCRAYTKNNKIYGQPAKCKYNPYISKWEGEEGYISVEKYLTIKQEVQ